MAGFNTLDDIWQAVLQYCMENGDTPAFSYKQWIEPFELTEFTATSVTLETDSLLKYRVIREKFDGLMHEAFTAVLGFDVEINYVCTTTEEEVQQNILKEQREAHTSGEYTFENFVEGGSNKFAYRAAKAVAEDPGGQLQGGGSNYNPLFIYGNSGLGKTHLLNAICYEVKNRFPNMKYLYTTAESFMNDFITMVSRNKQGEAFRDKYRGIDMLLIDDIQFIAGKDATEEEFFHTFNSLVDLGKQIVITADRPPREIKSLADRLCSRFENGLMADIQPPEYETRCAIVKMRAEQLGYTLSDQIVDYIARNVETNIRQLEGITNDIIARHNLSGEAITLGLAQRIVKDLNKREAVVITTEKIVDEVSRFEGIDVDDIYSKKQQADIVHARNVAMYVIRELKGESLEKIGAEFGGKSHSTVKHGIENIEAEMQRDNRTSRVVNDIIGNLRNM